MARKHSLWQSFLTIFGDIKVFKWPMFILYDPGSYLVKGEDMRQVIATIKAGDILVRSYKNYLDGFFIPGYFSHAGLYVGKVVAEDEKLIELSEGKKHFRTGDQMVVHSMAEGVFMEDVLNFCRCDYLAILRLPDQITPMPGVTGPKIDTNYFSREEEMIQSRISKGAPLSSNEAVRVMTRIALSKLGREYDFHFDFDDFHNFSCTELVYYSMKSFGAHLEIRPSEKPVLFARRKLLEPDALVASKLSLVWKSRSVSTSMIEQLRSRTEPLRRK